MSKRSGFYPRVRVDGAGKGVVSQAGGSLLTDTVRASGLDRALSGSSGDHGMSAINAFALEPLFTGSSTL